MSRASDEGGDDFFARVAAPEWEHGRVEARPFAGGQHRQGDGRSSGGWWRGQLGLTHDEFPSSSAPSRLAPPAHHAGTVLRSFITSTPPDDDNTAPRRLIGFGCLVPPFLAVWFPQRRGLRLQ